MAHTTRRVPQAIAAFLIAVGAALGLVMLQPIAAHAGETDTIYSLVNDERFNQGSSGLVRNPAMDAVAASWATALAQAGTLSHNPNYSSQIPGGWVAAAENVAQGYGGGAAMHAGWMNSAGHRANILGNFTDIGIAYLEAGGTTWGVEVFANYPGTVTPTPPAAAPAPAPAPAPVPAPDEPIAEAQAPDAETPAVAEGPTEGSAQAPAGTPAQAGLPTSPPAATAAPGAHSRVPTDTNGGNDARDTTTAAALENARPASSATDRASSLSELAPLVAALLAAALVAAVGIRSYRLRNRAAKQAQHPL